MVEAADRAAELYLSESAASDPEVAAWLEGMAADAFVLSPSAFASVSTLSAPDGFLALCERRVVALESYRGSCALVPARIQDPGNLGAMIRAAAAFFPCPLLVAGPGAVDPFSPKVVRAAAGSLSAIMIAEVGDLSEGLRQLREGGFALLGLEMSGESIWELPAVERLCLVVGSEGSGISPEVRSLLDHEVQIPQQPQVESLNAAAAASVALAVLSRKAGLLA